MKVSKSCVLVVAVMLGSILAACSKSDEKSSPGQIAAKVDGKEISVLQLNLVMKNIPNVNAENADSIRKQVLDKLVDQQVVLNKALEEKVDRSAEVVSAIEAAKRDIITRTYLTNLVSVRAKPSSQQVKDYFDTHPELFSARRIYNLQDIALPPRSPIPADLKQQVERSKSMQEVAEWLKGQGVRFGASSYSKPAEQIPTDALAVLKSQRDGAMVMLTMDGNTHVVKLVGAVTEPMSYEQAKPLIQVFLTNSEGQKLIKAELSKLKEKANIQYVGAFSKDGSTAKVEKVEPKPVEKNNSHIEKGVVGLD